MIFLLRSPCATAVVTSAMLRTWFDRLSASVFTLSVRSFHVPDTPFTFAWPPRMPSVPTSRATRVTSSANDESWSTIVLIVSASAATSPDASTVILRVRSPFATAVVTSAMFRTCVVRFDAMKFTLSVRSAHTPETPSTRAWPPRIPSEPTSRATRVTSDENARSWSTIALMVSFSSSTSPRTSTVIFFDRSPFATAVVTSAMLRTCVVSDEREPVHRVGQVLPRPADALDVRLAAEDALGADLAGDARHLVGERRELVDHRVDRVGERGDLAASLDGDLARQVAVRDGRRHVGDVAHLGRQVVRHEVHRVGEVLPRAADVLHVGLAAEDAFGADLAGDAGHLGCERRRADRPSC